MINIKNYLLLLVATLFAVACTTAPVSTGGTPIDTGSNNDDTVSTSDLPVLNANVIYMFDLDSSEVKLSDYEALDANIKYILDTLAAGGDIQLIIEGHADERGTEDYNFALGNRRAYSIADYMKEQGVPASVIRTETYGELSPVNPGSNEDAWAQNRRAVINYQ